MTSLLLCPSLEKYSSLSIKVATACFEISVSLFLLPAGLCLSLNDETARATAAAAAAAAVTVPAPLSSVNNNGLGNRKWEPSSSLLDGSSDDVSLVVFFDGQHASHLLEAIARIQTVRPRIRRVAVAFFSPSSERTQPLPPPPPPLDSSSLSLPWASDRCSFLYVHLMGYEGKGMLRKTKDFASLWACHVEWWTTSSPPAADPLLFSRYQLFISQ